MRGCMRDRTRGFVRGSGRGSGGGFFARARETP
jgi:hypothetical protein